MPIWLAFVEFLKQVLLTFYRWTGSAGFAIILFTIVARLVILPLTIKSLQSSRKMQELQPHMKELQRKYGKDPQKLQEETMRLYREYKVNPSADVCRCCCNCLSSWEFIRQSST
jgi:YidC/Oxa1 family membrane protein insertase